MTWTCTRCGRNHGDRKVEEELREQFDAWLFDVSKTGETIEGWQCDYCGKRHPTPEQPSEETETDAGNIQVEKVIEIVDDSMDEFPDHDLCHTATTLAGKIKDKARAEGDTQSK